jgi:heme oxygenase
LAKDIAYLVSLKPASEWTIDPRDTTSTTLHPSMPTPPFAVPPFLEPLFTSPPPAITSFTNHLVQISATRPALLLAHAYVRYLGDLSGGQIVRSRIRRVYTLDPPSISNTSETASTQTQDGTEFYEFDIFDSSDRPILSGAAVAQPTMYERKQRMSDIKDWFRSVLDSGTADNAEDLKRTFLLFRYFAMQLT